MTAGLGFQRELNEGRQAEEWVLHLLRSAGMRARPNPDRTPAGLASRDIDVEVGGRRVGVEVKFDKRSASTGNLAVEYWATLRNEPSGLYATKAALWVHVVPKPLAAFVVPVRHLKAFVKSADPLRIVHGAGDDNADILLYPLGRILPVFHSLDETPSHERARLVRRLCGR